MDIFIVASVVIFFIGLTVYGLMKTPTLKEDKNAFADNLEALQHEPFPWGEAWVYDNDRDRKSPLLPIVFVHGLGSSLYSWRFQIKALAASSPLIAVDLLGFGKSSKPQDQSYNLDGHSQRLLDILDQKKIERCYLVGCSLGGALALWLTSRHPERFVRTLAISPAAASTLAPFPSRAYDSLAPVGSRVVSRHIIRMALQGGLVYHDRITPEVVDTYLAPFRDPGGVASFFKTIATIKDPRIYESLKDIQNPVLILRGGGDRVVNRKIIQYIHSANSHFELQEHPVAGHHLMEDEPEWVNSQIRRFFNLEKSSFDS